MRTFFSVPRALILTFVVVFVMVFATGCYYDSILPAATEEYTETVSFSADIIPSLNTHCNSSGCHDGSVKPNLSPAVAYNTLVAGGYTDAADPANSKLYRWMSGFEATPMPPAGPNQKINALFLAWIKQGTSNN